MEKFPYDDMLSMAYPNYEIEKEFPDKVLRAAQFAPFAALTGFDDAVEETARVTEEKMELNFDMAEELNRILSEAKEHQGEDVSYIITYFVPDEKKDGGTYLTISDRILAIKEYEKLLVCEKHGAIFIPDIIKMEQKNRD